MLMMILDIQFWLASTFPMSKKRAVYGMSITGHILNIVSIGTRPTVYMDFLWL